jgi:hypothetical protein
MNFTETQKRVLLWLVEEVRAGNLDEEEIWFAWTFNGSSLVGYKGNPRNIPEVKTTTLDALQSSDCLTCNRSRPYEYKCSLTAKAYETVDSNFGISNHKQPKVLENLMADGLINNSATMKSENKSNNLAEKIGVVAQLGSVINIDTLNVGAITALKYASELRLARCESQLTKLREEFETAQRQWEYSDEVGRVRLDRHIDYLLSQIEKIEIEVEAINKEKYK